MQVNNKILDMPIKEIGTAHLQEIKELSYLLTAREVAIMDVHRKVKILNALGYRTTKILEYVLENATVKEATFYRVLMGQSRNPEIREGINEMFCTKLKIPLEESTSITT